MPNFKTSKFVSSDEVIDDWKKNAKFRAVYESETRGLEQAPCSIFLEVARGAKKTDIAQFQRGMKNASFVVLCYEADSRSYLVEFVKDRHGTSALAGKYAHVGIIKSGKIAPVEVKTMEFVSNFSKADKVKIEKSSVHGVWTMKTTGAPNLKKLVERSPKLSAPE